MEEKLCPLKYENSSLYILDQSKLPHEIVMEKQNTIEDVYNSIKMLKVRGAPLLGIASAYGLLIGIKNALSFPKDDFYDTIEAKVKYLISSRPTAVNISYAMKRMLNAAENNIDKENVELYKILEDEALRIHWDDIALCDSIGEYGLTLIKENMNILTHCNAGILATGGIGTAFAPIYKAKKNSIKVRVYADETRPLLQGGRLTAFELTQNGIDTVLICDNMASYLMSKGMIDMVIVGCDRVAKNGDTANKIGTLSVAISAKYYGIPFYVACPSSTFDKDINEGKDIVIEERQSSEVKHFGKEIISPENVNVFNPAFDVTPSSLITGFITEKGIIYPPFEKNLLSSLV